MRIAMIGPFGFSPKKTMRSRAFRIARVLAARGHQVGIFMPPWHTPDEANKTWVEDGVEIVYTAVDGGPLVITHRLQQQTLMWQPDVVHVFKPKAYSGLVAEFVWRTKRNHIRLVMDSDDWEGWGGWNDLEDYPRAAKHIFAKQEQWGMRHCHALTVASHALETLAWGNGVAPEKVVYLPNGSGIDLPPDFTHSAAPSTPTVLVYSRFFEFDVARLAALLQQVHLVVPTVKILVVGASLQAADGAEFMRLLDNFGMASNVTNAGWVAEKELPALLGQATVGVYPMDDTLLNRTKCPVKLCDMIALGLPVVGEAVGQVQAYVRHGVTGYLHQSGDVGAQSADIIQILQNRALRTQLSQAARQHYLDHFTWEKLAESAEKAYASP